MGDGYLLNPVIFLVDTLFGLYILVVMLRLLLQSVRADFYNPLSEFIVKATNPPLVPLRRIIPGVGGIDMASVVLVVILQLLAIVVIGLLHGGFSEAVSIPGLIMATVAKLVSLLLYIYLFSIFILAIMSWFATGHYNPVTSILASITDPLMRPVRRLIPPMGGLDLSALAVILGLYVARMLIMPPLYGLTVALGFPPSLLQLLY